MPTTPFFVGAKGNLPGLTITLLGIVVLLAVAVVYLIIINHHRRKR